MATTNEIKHQIKFYKKSTAPSGTGLQVGAIWFNTTNRTINVYTGDATEP